MKAWFTITIKDKEGHTLKRIRRPSRSMVLAYDDLLYGQMAQATHTIKDAGGTNRDVVVDTYKFACNAAAGDTGMGILWGSGDTAVAIDDYTLDVPISHGVGAGQLSYAAVSFTAPSTLGDKRSFTITRSATNASGANVTVKEIGLFVKASLVGAVAVYFLAIRDVLATAFTVPNGGAITTVYTIAVEV